MFLFDVIILHFLSFLLSLVIFTLYLTQKSRNSSMSAPILPVIQPITRYVMPIMVAVANISNILSIYLFAQKRHRNSSCSIYLIFAAASSIVSINWALIPNIQALISSVDMFGQSLVLCRLRGYILQVVNNLFRTFFILACDDRFAMSSSSTGMRSWATAKVAW